MRIIVLSFISFFICTIATSQNLIGRKVENVVLKDANQKRTTIPFLGQKVIAVFYSDPDVKDVNDPLSDAIKRHNFSGKKFGGVGIANSADSWMPNSAIRYGAREKEKRYAGSIVLIDENSILLKSWGLANCNDAGCVLIIGTDQRIKFTRLIKSQEESKAVSEAVIKIIDDEIARVE